MISTPSYVDYTLVWASSMDISNCTNIVSIGSIIMDVNDTITLPITIANATNIQQATFDLIYDPDIVTITNITANDAIPSSTITYTLDSGNAAIDLINPDNITVTNTTLLIDITFQTGENTGTTTLELQNIKLIDNIGPHAPDTIINGSITVCVKGDFNNNNIGDVAQVAFMVTENLIEDSKG